MYRYNYFECELPEGWCTEEDDDTLAMYDPEGEGAITVSFYSVVNKSLDLAKTIYHMTESFINQNGISLHGALAVDSRNERKIMVVGTGTTDDNYYCKIWCIARFPKIVMATYFSQELTDEVKTCDKIIDSIQFRL